MTDDKGLSLIWIHTRGCGSCRRQREEYERNPPSLPLRGADAATPEGCALMRRHGVGDAPTTVLVDGKGRTVKVWAGEVETASVERFLRLSSAWIDERVGLLDAMDARAAGRVGRGAVIVIRPRQTEREIRYLRDYAQH